MLFGLSGSDKIKQGCGGTGKGGQIGEIDKLGKVCI